jgi:hypothetical protein
MATASYNQAIDYFGLESASSDKLKVVASNENRSAQTAAGANTYGDSVVVDMYGNTSQPTSEYQVVGTVQSGYFASVKPGTVLAAGNGISNKYGVGSITVSTGTGSVPRVTVQGQELAADSATLRTYSLPTFSLPPRHRAQDFLGLCTIKRTVNDEADMGVDYGLESVTATFPVEFTLTQVKGGTEFYDVHGGTCTCSFTMNWYANNNAPGITLSDSAPSGAKLTSPRTRSDPENGYTQYTWTVSWPFVGAEAASMMAAPPPSGNGESNGETGETDGESNGETGETDSEGE